MKSYLLLSVLSRVSGNEAPGAFFSLSADPLNSALSDVTGAIVNTLKDVKIPGHSDFILQIDDLGFEDVSVGSTSVSVVPNEGLEISLKDMSNTIAHTHFCGGFPKKCCGEVWASATGQSMTALVEIVADEATGQSMIKTSSKGFSAGDVQIHHKMENFLCEAVADGLGLLNSVIAAGASKALELAFPMILDKVVSVPGDKILNILENPPAIGLGAEKFQLDNHFVSVDYSNNRLTHYHKGEFKSTVHPKESRQIPAPLTVTGSRDIELGFADYVFNTLFEALKAEHIGEAQIELPIHTPTGGPLASLCSGCPAVVQVKFTKRGECSFMGGKATNTLGTMKFQVGVKKGLIVLPAFTVTVDATADIAFALDQPSGQAPTLKATFALDSFHQKDVISVIGEIHTEDLNRDIEALLGGLLDKINGAVPPLPILSLPGTKYENPAFVVDNHQLLIQSDLVKASAITEVLV